MNKKLALGAALLVVLAAVSSCASDDRFRRAATAAEMANADDLAHAMIEQLGGKAAWDALEVIEFAFVVESGVRVVSRQHLWDKKRGLHRVSLDDKVVYTNLWDGKGRVFEGDVEVTDPEARDEALTEAYKAFINDTWWLAAPFKVFDDGVNRAAMGGDLRLTFGDGIGLTSGDAYLLKLDEQAQLKGWAFDLESGLKAAFDFEEPERIHGVTFYARRTNPLTTIRFEGLQGFAQAVPQQFEPLKKRRPDAF